MKKQTRLIIGWTVGVILAGNMFLWSYLFGHAGGVLGIIVLPVDIGISIGFGIATYVLLEGARSKIKACLIVLGILAGVTVAQTFLYPSEVNPFSEVSSYWTTFWKYPDEITYDDLASDKSAYKVAAMVKYRNDMPDKLLTIVVGYRLPAQEIFWAELRNGVLDYDTNRLQLPAYDENKGLWVFHPNGPDRKQYRISASLKFLFGMDAYGGASGQYDVVMWVQDFSLRLGGERVFYDVLSFRK